MKNEAYAADWVVPIGSAPIRDGAVVADRDRVVWIGPIADLPEPWTPITSQRGVLVPGLVNAHTHLQYTGFEELGRGRYTSFEHWAEAFGEVYDVADRASWRPAARRGARMGIASGTTVFAEIVTDDSARGVLPTCGVGGIEYLEAMAQFQRSWASGGRRDFLAWLDQPIRSRPGISPHAPYSLDGSVIADLVEIAASRGLRLHTHLGESSIETRLYREGDASILWQFGDLRDEFQLVRSGGTGLSTAGYADSLGLLTASTHIAHGIYLDRDDRDLLLRRGTRVALCPRSNAVIGLAEAPVADYLREGHEIAVGTDSLASSPSMDLMADVAELHRIAVSQGYTDSDLAERLIVAATLGGARALGLDQDGYGTLRLGGPADLALFDVAVPDGDVYGALVRDGAGSCVLTVCGGRVLYSR